MVAVNLTGKSAQPGEAEIVGISVKTGARCLLFRVEGLFSTDLCRKLADSILEQVLAKNQRRVVVDVRSMTGNPSVMDLYKVATYATKLAGTVFRIAVLDRRERVGTQYRFFENLSVNRAVSLRVCWTVAQAQQWVGEDISDVLSPANQVN
jgi:hypothetical protein